MNKLRQLFLTIALLCAVASFTGCQTLDPAGPYQGNTALYKADQTILSSYDILHSFVTWEYQNRSALAKYPDIKKSADYIRENTRQWMSSAVTLRDVYAAQPTDENKSALDASIAVLQAALAESTKYLQTPIK